MQILSAQKMFVIAVLCLSLSLFTLLQSGMGVIVCNKFAYRLILIQKRIVRSIAKAEYLAPSEPIFKELKILKVMEINSLQNGTFMFSYCNNLLPRSYDNLFVSGSQIHHYNTRTAQNPRPHRCRTTLKSQTITYQGPVSWNFLNDFLNVW